MGRTASWGLSFLVLLCGLFASSSHRLAQTRAESPPPRRLVKIFSVGRSPGVVLVNSSLRGNISVQAWDRPQIRLVALGQAPDAQVNVRLTNDVLTVKVQRHRAPGSDDVDLEVTVPAEGFVEASTIGGKITVRGMRGRLKLSTVEGDIELVDLSSPSVDAMSVTTGRIAFSGQLEPRGIYTFYSGQGTIEVIVPKESSFTLDASTHEGRIESEGIHLRSPLRTASHLQGVSGAGGARLQLRTHAGRIRLRSR